MAGLDGWHFLDREEGLGAVGLGGDVAGGGHRGAHDRAAARARGTTSSARTPGTSAWTAARPSLDRLWRAACGSTSRRATSSPTRPIGVHEPEVRRERHGLPVARRRHQRARRASATSGPRARGGASTRTSSARGLPEPGLRRERGHGRGVRRDPRAVRERLGAGVRRRASNPQVIRATGSRAAGRSCSAGRAARSTGISTTDGRQAAGVLASAWAATRPPGRGPTRRSVSPAVEWKPVSELLHPASGRSWIATSRTRSTSTSVAAPGEVPADFGGLRYVFAPARPDDDPGEPPAERLVHAEPLAPDLPPAADLGGPLHRLQGAGPLALVRLHPLRPDAGAPRTRTAW